MYPHERSLVEKYADQPFAIIGVNSDQDLDKLRQTIKEKELTWRSFFDCGGTGGPIATRWGVRGWPSIYVLDHEGRIRYKDVRGEDLDAALEDLIPKATEAAKG